MFSDDEPTSIVKIVDDYASRARLSSHHSLGQLRGVSHGQDERSPGLKRQRFGSVSQKLAFEDSFVDPLSSTIGRKRFASEAFQEDEREVTKLKNKVIEAEANLVDAKSIISKLETQMKKMQLVHKKFQLDCEQEMEAMKKVKEACESKYLDVKRENEILKAKEKQRLEDESFNRRTSNHKRHELSERCGKLEEENLRLREELHDMETDIESVKRDHQEEMDIVKQELQVVQSRLEEQDAREELEDRQVAEIGRLRQELETAQLQLQTSQHELLQVKDQLQQNEDAVVQRNAMRETLAHYPKILKENEALKAQNKLLNETMENTDLLKERVEDLQSRLDASELAKVEAQKYVHDLENLKHQLRTWQSACRQMLNAEERAAVGEKIGPDVLNQKVMDLHKQELLTKAEIENLKSSLSSMTRKCQKANEENGEFRAKNSSLQTSQDEQSKLIKRFQRKLLLVSKERDSYKKIIESYEHEITITGAQLEKDKAAAHEKIIADHKDMIEKLEKHISQLKAGEKVDIDEGGHEKLSATLSQCKRLEEALEEMQKERDKLRIELEQRAIKDYNPADTKVLHFKMNPLAEASSSRSADVAQLQEENEALKTRVKLLEEGQTKDLTLLVGQKVEEGTSSQEVQTLKEQLKSAELKRTRLLEAFKKTSQEFREVAYQLTGYRIDVVQNSAKYRLSSIYAEAPDDHLLFQRGRNGEMLLLQTGFSDQLGDLIDLHLSQQHSIPSFLAAVTLDLFSRQTFDTYSNASEDEEEEEHGQGDDDDPICLD